MRILVAMDSFKGNLSSLDVSDIVAKGIKKVFKDADIETIAVADGGEGTIEAFVSSLGGELVHVKAKGPLHNIVDAKYAIINGDTAIIETAQASGLNLIAKDERNPLFTSTYGTGQLILSALDKGCRRIILALGGSATNDGGTGISKALGIRFITGNGNEAEEGGGFLDKITHIDMSNKDPRIMKSEMIIITDVSNTLLGAKGASRIYSPQKGATSEMVEILETNMQHYAKMLYKHTGKDVVQIKGTGAAGGIGASLSAFFDARIYKGTDFILDMIGLEDKIRNTDIVITGEGRVDKQTSFGKLPVGISKIAKKYSKPVFLIAGYLDEGYQEVYKKGIDAVVSSMVGPMSLDEAIEGSAVLIENAAINLSRIIKAVMNAPI